MGDLCCSVSSLVPSSQSEVKIKSLPIKVLTSPFTAQPEEHISSLWWKIIENCWDYLNERFPSS